MSLENDLVRFIAPNLQHLRDVNQLFSPLINSASMERTRQIWQTLAPEIQLREVAQEAVDRLAVNPNSLDWQRTLASQLQNIFSDRPEVASRVKAIWQIEISLQPPTDHSIIQMSIKGSENQAIGSVSGNAKVIGNISGPASIDMSNNKKIADQGSLIDESLGKTSVYRGGQIVGGNLTHTGSKILSENKLMIALVFMFILSIGAAWLLGLRLSPKGIEINTQGGKNMEQPKNATP